MSADWSSCFRLQNGQIVAKPLKGWRLGDDEATDVANFFSQRVASVWRPELYLSPHDPILLRELNLGNNQIGDSGVRALVSAILGNNVSLKKIWLHYNHIGSGGGRAVSDLIEKAYIPLEEVHLSNNYLEIDEVWQLLFAAARRRDYPMLVRGEKIPLWLRLENNPADEKITPTMVKEADQKMLSIRFNAMFLPSNCYEPMICVVPRNAGGCKASRCKHAHEYGPIVHLSLAFLRDFWRSSRSSSYGKADYYTDSQSSQLQIEVYRGERRDDASTDIREEREDDASEAVNPWQDMTDEIAEDVNPWADMTSEVNPKLNSHSGHQHERNSQKYTEAEPAPQYLEYGAGQRAYESAKNHYTKANYISAQDAVATAGSIEPSPIDRHWDSTVRKNMVATTNMPPTALDSAPGILSEKRPPSESMSTDMASPSTSSVDGSDMWPSWDEVQRHMQPIAARYSTSEDTPKDERLKWKEWKDCTALSDHRIDSRGHNTYLEECNSLAHSFQRSNNQSNACEVDCAGDEPTERLRSVVDTGRDGELIDRLVSYLWHAPNLEESKRILLHPGSGVNPQMAQLALSRFGVEMCKHIQSSSSAQHNTSPPQCFATSPPTSYIHWKPDQIVFKC